MSSIGAIREITPLLPCRPAILSPGCSLRFTAQKTLTILSTPGGSSSPRCSFSTLFSKRSCSAFRPSSSCRLRPWISVIRSASSIPISHQMPARHAVQRLGIDLAADPVPLRARGDLLPDHHLAQPPEDVALQDRALVVAVLGQTLDLGALDGDRALVLLDAAAVEDADLDDRALHARRHLQGGVADVGGLLAEDGPQQLLLGRHRRLALGRDLADQDVARLHLGADIDDARLVEVAERLLADVRDVACDALRPELGVAGHHLELLDVDRGEHVVADDALRDEDRVLEVVAVPGHEGDEHVAAQRQLAQLGRRAVGDDVAGGDGVAHLHQRPLVDAGVLVRALELPAA